MLITNSHSDAPTKTHTRIGVRKRAHHNIATMLLDSLELPLRKCVVRHTGWRRQGEEAWKGRRGFKNMNSFNFGGLSRNMNSFNFGG